MLIVLLLEKMCHGLKFKKSFQLYWKNIGNVNKMFAFQELKTLSMAKDWFMAVCIIYLYSCCEQ